MHHLVTRNTIWPFQSAVEAGAEGDWDAVTNAHLDAVRAAKKDQQAEVDGRNYLDNLDKVSNWFWESVCRFPEFLCPLNEKRNHRNPEPAVTNALVVDHSYM